MGDSRFGDGNKWDKPQTSWHINSKATIKDYWGYIKRTQEVNLKNILLGKDNISIINKDFNCNGLKHIEDA